MDSIMTYYGYLNMEAFPQNRTISFLEITSTEENSRWRRYAYF